MDLFVTKHIHHRGFTLIELVVVIIILGIIAVIAMPKFINLRQDAEIATHQATGGAFKGGITLANVKWAAAEIQVQRITCKYFLLAHQVN